MARRRIGQRSNRPRPARLASALIALGAVALLLGWALHTPETLDVTSFDYRGEALSTATIDPEVRGVFLAPDGTRLFLLGGATATLYPFRLATPWDLRTAQPDGAGLKLAVPAPSGLVFSADGTRFYVAATTGAAIHAYALATPWDVSSARLESDALPVGDQEPAPGALHLNPDGTRLYVVGTERGTVFQYALSTPWELRSARYEGERAVVAREETRPRGLAFAADGTRLLIVGPVRGTVFQFTLEPPWQVSNAAYRQHHLPVAGQDATPAALYQSPDGARLFVAGAETRTLYAYEAQAHRNGVRAARWVQRELLGVGWRKLQETLRWLGVAELPPGAAQ